MNYDFFRILKWALIVLIAGFIGQFGRTFAKQVMTYVGRKHGKNKFPVHVNYGGADRDGTVSGENTRSIRGSSPFPSTESGDIPDYESAPSKEDLKQRKKTHKNRVKKNKKETKEEMTHV